MNLKHICMAGVAVAALTVGASAAQAETTEEATATTRSLNLDQLEKARDGSNAGPPAMSEEDMEEAEDGQGGPELDDEPSPDEGMTDDDVEDDDAAVPDSEDEMPEDEPAPMD